MWNSCAVAALAAAFLLVGCGEETKKKKPGLLTGSGGSGMGSSTEEPTGDPFVLPYGIRLGTLSGDVDSDCWDAPRFGVPGNVSFCAPITAEEATDVVLPAGLVFVSSRTTTQNGILLQPIAIPVPAGETTVVIQAFCINRNRDNPGPGDTFDIGRVTNVDDMNDLISRLRHKDLDAQVGAGSMPGGKLAWTDAAYVSFEGSRAYELVQEMVFAITEGGWLTATDLDAIEALAEDP